MAPSLGSLSIQASGSSRNKSLWSGSGGDSSVNHHPSPPPPPPPSISRNPWSNASSGSQELYRSKPPPDAFQPSFNHRASRPSQSGNVSSSCASSARQGFAGSLLLGINSHGPRQHQHRCSVSSAASLWLRGTQPVVQQQQHDSTDSQLKTTQHQQAPYTVRGYPADDDDWSSKGETRIQQLLWGMPKAWDASGGL